MTKKIAVIESSGNVFEDVGFGPEEAKSLQMRAKLMLQLSQILRDAGKSQHALGALLGIGQSRVSDLMKGKARLFSLDMLVTLFERIGQPVSVYVGHKVQPDRQRVHAFWLASSSASGNYAVSHEVRSLEVIAPVASLEATDPAANNVRDYLSNSDAASFSVRRYGPYQKVQPASLMVA